MENIIFYFSGTGNSLAVARDIAKKLGNTKLVSISDAIKNTSCDLSFERIGFVFPSYYACAPSIVKRFISILNFKTAQYIFGVVTFGGSYGMTLAQLGRAISKQGGTLNAGLSVRMPGNYIDNYSAWPSALQKFVLNRESKKIDRILSVIKMKGTKRIPQGSLLIRSTEKEDLRILDSFGSMAKNFHTNEKCTGCGVCEKICPVDNIKISEALPAWGDTCEHCMACIQWCPQQAIDYSDITEKRTRYRHPQIKLSDFVSKQ